MIHSSRRFEVSYLIRGAQPVTSLVSLIESTKNRQIIATKRAVKVTVIYTTESCRGLELSYPVRLANSRSSKRRHESSLNTVELSHGQR